MRQISLAIFLSGQCSDGLLDVVGVFSKDLSVYISFLCNNIMFIIYLRVNSMETQEISLLLIIILFFSIVLIS